MDVVGSHIAEIDFFIKSPLHASFMTNINREQWISQLCP